MASKPINIRCIRTGSQQYRNIMYSMFLTDKQTVNLNYRVDWLLKMCQLLCKVIRRNMKSFPVFLFIFFIHVCQPHLFMIKFYFRQNYLLYILDFCWHWFLNGRGIKADVTLFETKIKIHMNSTTKELQHWNLVWQLL